MLKAASRGQAIPFWTFITIGLLAMMLTVLNYALTVTWGVRSQSAAESAAAAGVSSFANVYNTETTLLYATAVDEYRVRSLNQALLNTIKHDGGCSRVVGGSCEQNYAVLRSAYYAALAEYTHDVQLIGQTNGIVQGGVDTDVSAAISDYTSRCATVTAPGADCAFSYSVVAVVADSTNQYGEFQGQHNDYTTPRLVEVIACHNVGWLGGRLFGLSGTFQAAGTATAASVTANAEIVQPATYQSAETSWYGRPALPYVAPAYEVDYRTSTGPASEVDLLWYTTASIHNISTVSQGSYTCAS